MQIRSRRWQEKGGKTSTQNHSRAIFSSINLSTRLNIGWATGIPGVEVERVTLHRKLLLINSTHADAVSRGRHRKWPWVSRFDWSVVWFPDSEFHFFLRSSVNRKLRLLIFPVHFEWGSSKDTFLASIKKLGRCNYWCKLQIVIVAPSHFPRRKIRGYIEY